MLYELKNIEPICLSWIISILPPMKMLLAQSQFLYFLHDSIYVQRRKNLSSSRT